VEYARFSWAWAGCFAYDGTDLTVRHCQFFNCNYGLGDLPANVHVQNDLFSQCDYPIYTDFNARVEQVTVDTATNLCQSEDGMDGLFVTNSIAANVGGWIGEDSFNTNPPAPVLDHAFKLPTASGLFQNAYSGSYYLCDGSTNRAAGTTNVDPVLLAALRQKTTAPPIAFTNVTFSTDTSLSPQAQRENGPPDIGFGYDPLDYLFGGCDAEANLVFSAGTAVGWFRTSQGWYHAGHGIHIGDGHTLFFNGTATAPCYWVRWSTVQEGIPATSEPSYGPGGITGWTWPNFSQAPVVSMRFTHCSLLAWEAMHMRDDNGYLIVHARDSEFWNGGCGGYVSQLDYTNCLFDDVSMWTSWNGVPTTNCTFVLQNCLVRNGVLNLNRTAADSHGNYPLWFIHDTAFESGTLEFNDAGSGDSRWTKFDYNAYLTGADTTDPSGANDLTVTNFNWESSWFGNFYLPTNSPLIDSGSVTADTVGLGLYHFTTQTNQQKELSSQVDRGYHYIATDAFGNPVDTNGNGIPDYLENASGTGVVGSNETDWQDPADLGLQVFITEPKRNSNLP
jgi:hypothetical protein